MTPPRTMIPSGAPRAASHGGKLFSNGMINMLPRGERPRIASTRRPTNVSHRPARARRVGSNKRPRIPIKIATLDGNAKMPRSLVRTKNMSASPIVDLPLRLEPVSNENARAEISDWPSRVVQKQDALRTDTVRDAGGDWCIEEVKARARRRVHQKRWRTFDLSGGFTCAPDLL